MPSLKRTALLVVVAMFAIGRPVRAIDTTYTLTDLGTLSGGLCSEGLAVNNAGQVAGFTTVDGTDNEERPFLFKDGVMTQLAAGFGWATSINDAGQTVGFACPEDGPCFIEHAFVHQYGSTRFFFPHGRAARRNSLAYGINNRGTIVGEIESQGLIIESGVAYQINWPSVLSLTGINDANQVIGQLANSHGFVFDRFRLADLGTLDGAPGSDSRAAAINAAGQIAGSSYVSTTAVFRAFSYQNGTMSSLGTLHGEGEWLPDVLAYSLGLGINAAGDIVGESDGAAFIYRNGVMTDLNTLLPPDSPKVGRARAINDRGQIVGLVWTSPCGHAVLLTPVATEP